MLYNDFTWGKAKESFNLTTIEGSRFFPEIADIPPSDLLKQQLDRTLPWAIATGNEKLTLTLDLMDYPLEPLGALIGKLSWMLERKESNA